MTVLVWLLGLAIGWVLGYCARINDTDGSYAAGSYAAGSHATVACDETGDSDGT